MSVMDYKAEAEEALLIAVVIALFVILLSYIAY